MDLYRKKNKSQLTEYAWFIWKHIYHSILDLYFYLIIHFTLCVLNFCWKDLSFWLRMTFSLCNYISRNKTCLLYLYHGGNTIIDAWNTLAFQRLPIIPEITYYVNKFMMLCLPENSNIFEIRFLGAGLRRPHTKYLKENPIVHIFWHNIHFLCTWISESLVPNLIGRAEWWWQAKK